MTLQAHLTMSVPRTAHYAMFGQPDSRPTDCWFVCHGYGQLAHRFLRRFEPAARPGRLIVAPEGLSRFYVDGANGTVGASWMTREGRDTEIEDHLHYLDALAARLLPESGVEQPNLVLGFSQGCATASRWVARGSARPATLVLWGELPAYDLTDDDYGNLRDQGTLVRLVVGRQDPYLSLSAVDRASQAIERHGLAVDIVVYDGGHEIDGPTLSDIS